MSGNSPYQQQPGGYPPQGPQAYPPQQAYQPYGGGVAPQAAYLQPHRGGMILALGLISWLLCPLLGLAPWLMGKTDLAAMKAGTMDRSGEGMTTAGLWIGLIALIMSIVGLVIGGLIFAFAFAAAGSGAIR